jgi:hypothetical protein
VRCTGDSDEDLSGSVPAAAVQASWIQPRRSLSQSWPCLQLHTAGCRLKHCEGLQLAYPRVLSFVSAVRCTPCAPLCTSLPVHPSASCHSRVVATPEGPRCKSRPRDFLLWMTFCAFPNSLLTRRDGRSTRPRPLPLATFPSHYSVIGQSVDPRNGHVMASCHLSGCS